MKMSQLPTVNESDFPEKKRLEAYQKERELQYKELLETVMKNPSALTAVRNLIFEASKFESRYETALEKTKEAEKDKANYEKVLRIISARLKLEGFVDKLYPLRLNSKTGEIIYGKPDASYCDALNEMLASKDVRFTQDPFVCMVRKRLADHNILVPVFMKFVRWLYNQFSDKTCHKMAQFSPPLPRFDDINGIMEMLQFVEIDRDVPAVICIQIMLQPLDLPPNVLVSTAVASP